ncbi:methyltransferase domain-containing protein [Actinomycetes bacterium KLBMP 9759]
MSTWLDEWNQRQDVYVADRHRDQHFRAIADAVTALLPSPRARLLDYGPGEALFAGDIAKACHEVILCEAADSIRNRLVARFAGHTGVTVIEPGQLPALAAGSIDLIVVHSVVQYLDPDELDALLGEASRLLSPTGRLVVSDIVPPGVGLLSDVAALLRFAYRGGFLREALVSLVRNAVSPYSRTRRSLGLQRLDVPAMSAKARRAGLAGHRLPANLGDNRSRWAYIAQPRGTLHSAQTVTGSSGDHVIAR